MFLMEYVQLIPNMEVVVYYTSHTLLSVLNSIKWAPNGAC